MPDDSEIFNPEIFAELADLRERVRALEEAALGTAARPAVAASNDRRLTARETALREGRSVRRLKEAVKDGKFPPPDIINGRWFWWLSVLERFDRERIRGVARTPPGSKAVALAQSESTS